MPGRSHARSCRVHARIRASQRMEGVSWCEAKSIVGRLRRKVQKYIRMDPRKRREFGEVYHLGGSWTKGRAQFQVFIEERWVHVIYDGRLGEVVTVNPLGEVS